MVPKRLSRSGVFALNVCWHRTESATASSMPYPTILRQSCCSGSDLRQLAKRAASPVGKDA